MSVSVCCVDSSASLSVSHVCHEGASSVDNLFTTFISAELTRSLGCVSAWADEEVALRVVAVLRRVVDATIDSTAPQFSAQHLLQVLTRAAQRFNSLLPDVIAAHTPLLRLLKLTREQLISVCPTSSSLVDDTIAGISGADCASSAIAAGTSAGGLLLHARAAVQDLPSTTPAADDAEAGEAVREDLLAALDELCSELETASDSVSADAATHIRANDVVLTMVHLPDGPRRRGLSAADCCDRLVVETLRRAALTSSFRVLLVCPAVGGGARCECCSTTAARLGGNNGTDALSASVIDLASVATVVSRVDRVLLAAHTVLADGGVRACVGARLLAAAAVSHSVPVLVLAASFRLSPLIHGWGCRQSFARLETPEAVMPYAGAGRETVLAPLFDYVPPQLVTLFVTQSGAVSPWYVHRLLADYYDSKDAHLFRK